MTRSIEGTKSGWSNDTDLHSEPGTKHSNGTVQIAVAIPVGVCVLILIVMAIILLKLKLMKRRNKPARPLLDGHLESEKSGSSLL